MYKLNKLDIDLKYYELECKKSRFVYENYEREVTRWRKEVEEHEKAIQEKNFLSVPNKNHLRSGRSSSRSRSRSRSKWKNKDKAEPFQRITKRTQNFDKENDSIQINIEKPWEAMNKSKNRKSVKSRTRKTLKKPEVSKQKLKIKRPKSGKKRRM